MSRLSVVLFASGAALVTLLGACTSDEPDPLYFASPSSSATSGRRPGSNEPRGSGAKPNRSSYERACTTNADCVLVSFAESACDTCKCPNYAIAVDDQRKFFDEEQAFRATCNEPDKPCLADCAPLAARCIESQCTVVTTGTAPVRDAGPLPADDAATDAGMAGD